MDEVLSITQNEYNVIQDMHIIESLTQDERVIEKMQRHVAELLGQERWAILQDNMAAGKNLKVLVIKTVDLT